MVVVVQLGKGLAVLRLRTALELQIGTAGEIDDITVVTEIWHRCQYRGIYADGAKSIRRPDFALEWRTLVRFGVVVAGGQAAIV